jgi:fibro-slime domain-containing protein
MFRWLCLGVVILIVPIFGQSTFLDGGSCVNHRCPDGMICSNSLQHCICDNNASYSGLVEIDLPIIVYDFLQNNTDFENHNPDRVFVDPILGSDNLPIFNISRFNTWFKSTPGVNIPLNITLRISNQGNTNGVYRFADGLNYFPIDNQGWGNEGNSHNYHFTTKTSWTIDYQGSEYMYVRFDDGILVYLNRYLIINQPDLNYNGSSYLEIDKIAGDAGLVPGNSYSLHVFQMERHRSESIFYVETNLTIHPPTCPNLCQSDQDCHHGLCHPFEKICHCQQGWGGDYCDQPLCWNVDCGKHGTCNPYTGKCTCDRKWIGDRCEKKKCDYHGTPHANAPNKCDCDPYFTGDDCDQCIPGNGNRRNICRRNEDRSYSLVNCHKNDFELIIRTNQNFRRPGDEEIDCICRKRHHFERHDESTIAYYDRRVEYLRDGLGVSAIEQVEVSRCIPSSMYSLLLLMVSIVATIY